MLFYPFTVGFTFAFCRGGVLNSAPCAGAYLLVSLVPTVLLVAGLRWALLRRSADQAGWLPFAHLIGVVVFVAVYVTVRYDPRFLPLYAQLPALPNALAGLAYAMIVLLALAGLRSRRGTVPACTPSEPTHQGRPDDDRHLAAGPP